MACSAFTLLSFWFLNMKKYSAALTSAPPASTAPHCLMPDSSLKFAIVSLLKPCLLGLSLLAGQRELERLHVLNRVVLEGFLYFHRLEEARLLQVRDQVGHSIRAQRRAFQVYARARVIHAPQPDRFRSVQGFAQHGQQVDWPGLSSAHRINYVHAPLIIVGLPLPLQVARLYIAEFAVLLFGRRHLFGDRLRLLVQPVPVAEIQRPGYQDYDQHLQLGRSHIAHFHRRHRRSAGAALAFPLRCFEQVDSDHRDSKLLKAKPTATAS